MSEYNIPRITAVTPFLQNVPNSQVSQPWYRVIMTLAALFGTTAGFADQETFQTLAFTSRAGENADCDALSARVEALESLVQQQAEALDTLQRFIDGLQSQPVTASYALQAASADTAITADNATNAAHAVLADTATTTLEITGVLATSATAGSAAALPAKPAGYMITTFHGIGTISIPFY